MGKDVWVLKQVVTDLSTAQVSNTDLQQSHLCDCAEGCSGFQHVSMHAGSSLARQDEGCKAVFSVVNS